jgi:uncharacterized protein YkwD
MAPNAFTPAATAAVASASITSAQRRVLAVAAAAGIATAGLVGGAGGGTAHATTVTPAAIKNEPSMASYFVAKINAERVAHHRAKLTVNPALSALGVKWATQMAKADKLYHNPHLATDVTGWHYLGENVGVGYSDSSLEAAFYASAPHRANMLDVNYTRIGVGVVDVDGKLWVSEEFSKPWSTATAKKPAAIPTLREGSRGALVQEVQRKLHVTADGVFGPRTVAAVKSFQKRHGMSPSGVVGPKTRKALHI